MAPLDAQLAWLRDAGFSKVDCWFKSSSFVVYSGTKEAALGKALSKPC